MEDLILQHGLYTISTDKSKLQPEVIHHFLSNESSWARNISLVRVAKSIANSLNFGLYHAGMQIGYARVISDYATIAYLGDVFILGEYRGQGLSKILLEAVMAHPELQGLRRWMLLTADSHGLYKAFGWSEIEDPAKWMEIHNPQVYKS